MNLQEVIQDAGKTPDEKYIGYKIPNTACIISVSNSKDFLGIGQTITATYAFAGWEKATNFERVN